MHKRLLIILSLVSITAIAQAQSWEPGYFFDVKGNKEVGLIKLYPSGKSPIKDEAFIEFKEDNKASSIKLSASDLSSFVIGRDSFVVAVAPRISDWRNEFDFVKVAVDGDPKLYVFRGNAGGGGGGIRPELGVGIGGGFGGGGGKRNIKTSWYYGRNTAGMKQLTNANFIDIMSDIMGDEPDVVDQIRANRYNLSNIDKLIAYFESVQASHSSQ